jgi:hypothetical protein
MCIGPDLNQTQADPPGLGPSRPQRTGKGTVKQPTRQGPLASSREGPNRYGVTTTARSSEDRRSPVIVLLGHTRRGGNPNRG